MDQDQEKPSSSLSRKPRRFRPKIRQPSSDPQPTVPTPEPKKEDDAEVQARRRLLRQFNEAKARQGGPKVEKTSSVQVAFGPGASSSSSSIRTFGVRKDGNSAKGTGSGLKHSTSDDTQIVISSSSTAKEEGSGARSSNALALKVKEDYREPWDYAHTYYPTTLPWRPPYSGDPEILDEAEFGEEATRDLEYAENAINAASDLSLLDDSEEKKMMLFQFPANLPLNKRPASIKGKEKVESSSTSSGRVGAPMKASLKGLSGGYMGKLLVYQSGAIKLKLGDTLYDVSPGSDGSFAQDLVAINTEEKNCCVLGELGKRAVVAPDIDSLFPYYA